MLPLAAIKSSLKVSHDNVGYYIDTSPSRKLMEGVGGVKVIR